MYRTPIAGTPPFMHAPESDAAQLPAPPPAPGGGSAAARVYAHVKERLLDGTFAGRRAAQRERALPAARAQPDARAPGLRPARGRGPARALPQARRARRAGRGVGDRGRLRGAAARRGALRPPRRQRRRAARRRARAAHRRAGGGRRAGRDRDGRVRPRRPPLPPGDRRRGRQRDPHPPVRRAARPPAAHSAVSLARNPGDASRFVTEHRGIMEALGRGDADAAAERASAHLRAARDVARGIRDA